MDDHDAETYANGAMELAGCLFGGCFGVLVKLALLVGAIGGIVFLIKQC